MGVSRILFAALFLSLTVSTVSAYTLVMRDGRRCRNSEELRSQIQRSHTMWVVGMQ
jgi:hypothetical protein